LFAHKTADKIIDSI